MSTEKFTKGPWTVRRSHAKYDGAYDFAINALGAPVIAEAFGRSSDGGWPSAEANARLIAAAPDLFAAAALLPTHWLEGGVASDPRSDRLLIEMRIIGTTYKAEITVGDLRAAAAALASARGEAA